MTSKRVPRLNELMKREVAKVILREIDLPKEAVVTVTRVQVAPDLSQAQIYISVLPEKHFSKIFKILNSNISVIQKTINQLLIIRKVPKLRLIEDKTTREADRIEKLLEEIKNNG